MQNETMVKLIQALEKNRGLSVWIFDSEDDIPKYAKSFERNDRTDCIRYHSPSAIEFWDLLNKDPVRYWETIVTDKRKVKMKPLKIWNTKKITVIKKF